MPCLTKMASSSSNNGISPSNVQNITALEVDFRRESHRLMTYPETWFDICPYLNKYELAANGFFFTGPDDATRCAFCRLIIRKWEQGDTAEGEHRRWNPTCPFINGRYVGNVKVEDEERERNISSDVSSPKNKMQKRKNRTQYPKISKRKPCRKTKNYRFSVTKNHMAINKNTKRQS